ncbi:MAG: FAD-dependent oxidoreductase [Stellaceae bacterium]
MANELDLVVAGSGIAGLTAALTGARAGLRTLILTGEMLGGQLLSINEIDGLPGFETPAAGYDFCPITQELAVAAGAELVATTLDAIAPADGQWRLKAGDGNDYLARGLVLATGAELRKLGIPGEERLFGKGVSHCASCDAPLLKGKDAVVIGGGDSAAQEALTLAQTCARVTILHRGAAMSAQQAYRDRVTQQENIVIRYRHLAEEILGTSGVEAVRARDDAAGTTADIPADGVFVYIGLAPNTGFLSDRIALDGDGRIPTDVAMRTVATGICAAGAVRSLWPGRAAASAGDGATAALAMRDYLCQDRWRDG